MKEWEFWKGSSTWEFAEELHERLCTNPNHQMDGCWGMNLPYDLNQGVLSRRQRHWLGLALALREAFDEDQIGLLFTVLDENWVPEQLPSQAT